MALRELPSALRQLLVRDLRSTATVPTQTFRRYASGQAAAVQEASEDLDDLEPQSALTSIELPSEAAKAYDPIKRSQGRKRQLPASRYDAVPHQLKGKMLIYFTDTNIDPQDTIEDRSILTSLPQPRTLPHDSSCLAPSPTPASNKHGNLQLPQI